MFIQYDTTQLRKGILELFVLQILSLKSKYALEVVNELNEIGLQMAEGTLYPLLTRLKNELKIVYKWEESSAGPPRKYFIITKIGKEYLQQGLEAFFNLSDSLKNLTNIYK